MINNDLKFLCKIMAKYDGEKSPKYGKLEAAISISC